MYKIVSKTTLNNTTDKMEIYAPFVAKNAKPGHFIILRVDKAGERIPLTITEHTDETVTIIYQKLGYTTSQLGQKIVGDTVEDFVGPLGQEVEIKEASTLLAVAGGVGAAPLYPQLQAYHAQGTKVDLVIGAKQQRYLILLDDYKSICNKVYVCTDDGSQGTKGFVTDFLKQHLKNHTYDHSIAIGPLIMMKHVVSLHKTFNLSTDVSLNPIMIDGTGMCGNCRVSIGDKTYFACIDGPDFPGEKINFDELISRQSFYTEEEHMCQLEELVSNDKK
ncbi:MAG: sulfide/dihydroorotate dehydrogenase-like FAD/NAD-binding protein [Candidatus Izimaplasma sp.]|nr:sulfide/dihydroorotate dehydrogenase-like FAD/NAD-binding protein [Candidatus Izimaplasma bacterium]